MIQTFRRTPSRKILFIKERPHKYLRFLSGEEGDSLIVFLLFLVLTLSMVVISGRSYLEGVEDGRKFEQEKIEKEKVRDLLGPFMGRRV